jgi:hypothetical protein
MKAQSVMKSKLHAFFILPIDGGYVFSGKGGYLSVSVTYLIATSEASTAVAMATATWHKQHSHVDLNICINPLLKSPAHAYVLEF